MDTIFYIAVAGAIATFAFSFPMGILAASVVGLCSD